MCRINVIVLSAIIFLLISSPSQAKYSGGTGEPNAPYRIATPEDLNDIANHVEDFNKYFVMVNDINLDGYTGTQFNIIGRYFRYQHPNNVPFTGVFDGNDHIVRNFTWTSTGKDSIGLFGYVTGASAEIKNLGLMDPNIDVGTGDVVGSLIGWLEKGTVRDCYAESGKVSGNWDTGGLVGQNQGTILDCHSTTAVSGYEATGGLVGTSTHPSRYAVISDCYAVGDVSGEHNATGGLVGMNIHSTISNCYATGDASGDGDTGGLVGLNSVGMISNCCATGSVQGDDYTGGLVASNSSSSIITNCYASGDVGGVSSTGGLVAFNGPSSIVSNSHAVGVVDGTHNTGGLVAHNYGSVSNCYAAGDVNGMSNSGGLVGYHYSGSYTKCFWDNDVNPDVNGIGNTDDPNVIGKSTPQMHTRSTFTGAGWDLVGETANGSDDMWTIHEGQDYPKLVWPLVNFTGGWYEVDLLDFAFFADRWGQENCGIADDCDGADLDFSDAVGGGDLKILCDYWLGGAGL